MHRPIPRPSGAAGGVGVGNSAGSVKVQRVGTEGDESTLRHRPALAKEKLWTNRKARAKMGPFSFFVGIIGVFAVIFGYHATILQSTTDQYNHGMCHKEDPSGNVTHRIPNRSAESRTLRMQSLQNPVIDIDAVNVDRSIIDNNATAAICEVHVGQHSAHFAHAMQQLYQCWSYWNIRQNKDKERVLMIPRHAPGYDTPTTRPDSQSQSGFWGNWKWKVWFHGSNAGNAAFLTGFTTALMQAANVTIIRDYSQPKHGPSDRYRSYNPQWAVQRRDWANTFVLQSPEHARTLAACIITHYNLTREESAAAAAATTTPSKNNTDCRQPRIAILNRQRQSSRSLLNVNDLVDALQSRLGMRSMQHQPNVSRPDIQVVTFEDKSFLDQVQFFANVDIVLSPHGAQLTLLPFMPQCGRVLQVFPAHYYFDEFFGSLADAAGIDMYDLYLSHGNAVAEWRHTHNIKSRRQRRQVRNVNLCPPVATIVMAIQQMVLDWQMCCRSSNNGS